MLDREVNKPLEDVDPSLLDEDIRRHDDQESYAHTVHRAISTRAGSSDGLTKHTIIKHFRESR